MHMHRQTDIQTDIQSTHLPAQMALTLRARERQTIMIQIEGTTNTTHAKNRIRNQLQDIIQYTNQAAHELEPTNGTDAPSSERSIGIRLEALDLLAGHDVLPVLESWERMLREEWGYTPMGPTTAQRTAGQTNQTLAALTGTIHFHQTHLERTLQHPAARDYMSEITTCWHIARNAARAQPRTAWRVTCPTDTNTGECGHTLRVTGQDFGSTITCKHCHTTWHTERLLWVVASSTEADMWIDTEAAVKQTGIPEATLRRWGKQGRIKRKGALYEYKSLTRILTTITA